MYRFDPHFHQAGQVLGEGAPPKTLACPSGGPVCTGQKTCLSQGHKSQPELDCGTQSDLTKGATRQKAKDSWVAHGVPLEALTTAFQQSSAPGDTGSR